jgi:predicted CopG family antitoxin
MNNRTNSKRNNPKYSRTCADLEIAVSLLLLPKDEAIRKADEEYERFAKVKAETREQRDHLRRLYRKKRALRIDKKALVTYKIAKTNKKD